MSEYIVSFLLDAMIVGLFAFMIIRYSIRGFIKSFLAVLKTLLAPFIAILFCGKFGGLFSRWFLESTMQGAFERWLTSVEQVTLESGEIAYKVDSFFNGVPNFIVNWLFKFSEKEYYADHSLAQHFAEIDGVGPIPATANDIENMSRFFGNKLAYVLSAIIAFIIIFIIIEVIILLFSKLINKLLNKAITVKRLNILLGALVGVGVALLVVWLFATVIGALIDLGNHYYPNVFKEEYVENTLFLKVFTNNSLWKALLKLVIK